MRAERKFRPRFFCIILVIILQMERLAKILETNTETLSLKPCPGFSKKAFELSVGKKKYFLKSVNKIDLYFYEKVLMKSDKISVPKLIGYKRDKDYFWIITEWIQGSKTKESLIIKKMIKWLIQKDLFFIDKQKQIRKIYPSFNHGEGWWKMIEKTSKKGFLSTNQKKLILSQRSKFEEINKYLESGEKTVCHNDFEPKNAIVSKTKKLFMIDWTRPCWGPPVIDLARLVNSAPKKNVRKMIVEYRAKIDIEKFEEKLIMARQRDILSVFAAYCNHINNGFVHEINMEKFLSYAKILSSNKISF